MSPWAHIYTYHVFMYLYNMYLRIYITLGSQSKSFVLESDSQLETLSGNSGLKKKCFGRKHHKSSYFLLAVVILA